MTRNAQSLDLRGLKCPLPALRAAKALRALPSGAHLHITCTDPLAVIDIPNLLNETGDTLLEKQESDGLLHFLIQKR